jgi:hypothetical protein
MKRLLILTCLIIFMMPTQAIADCSTTACVDVFTENNQIIITAHKGNGGATTKKPVVIAPKPKPTLWFPPKPKPAPKQRKLQRKASI